MSTDAAPVFPAPLSELIVQPLSPRRSCGVSRKLAVERPASRQAAGNAFLFWRYGHY